MATMKEIAYICGVSRGTVDRVLNHRGNVRKETADRIWKVAQSLGHFSGTGKFKGVSHPNASTAGKIGVLVNAIDHEYFTDILEGISIGLKKLVPYGISSVIKLSGGFDVDQQLKLLDELLAEGINALAVTPANNPRIAERLTEITSMGLPVVVISSKIDNFDYFAYVGCDHYLSGRIAGGLACQILPNGGRIAVLTGLHVMPGLNQRIAGFIDAISSKNNKFEILEPVQGCDDNLISYKSVYNLVRRNSKIDLLLLGASGSDGAFRALTEVGLLGKIKILAFDKSNANLAQMRARNISAIFDQHPTKLGNRAIKLLGDYLQFKNLPAKRENYENIEILIDESFYRVFNKT